MVVSRDQRLQNEDAASFCLSSLEIPFAPCSCRALPPGAKFKSNKGVRVAEAEVGDIKVETFIRMDRPLP